MTTIENPVITEKSLQAAENGIYSFVVAKTATKPEIAKLVEKLYGVKVQKVRVVSVTGQTVRRKSGIGRKKDWKKALVTLVNGEKIKDFQIKEEKPSKVKSEE